jgi:hypothetical protein
MSSGSHSSYFAVEIRRPLWVKSGKARPEYLTSAFHPIADLIADIMGGPLGANSGLMQRSKMKSLFDHPIGALFVPNLTYA